MTVKVTEQGLLVPKELLRDVEEVEIRLENGSIVIIPATYKDPVLELGQQPVTADVEDASLKHDLYLSN